MARTDPRPNYGTKLSVKALSDELARVTQENERLKAERRQELTAEPRELYSLRKFAPEIRTLERQLDAVTQERDEAWRVRNEALRLANERFDQLGCLVTALREAPPPIVPDFIVDLWDDAYEEWWNRARVALASVADR